MLNLEEREVEALYDWKRNHVLKIDKVVEIVKKEAPKAYENLEFQQSIKDLKRGIEEYCDEKEKTILKI